MDTLVPHCIKGNLYILNLLDLCLGKLVVPEREGGREVGGREGERERGREKGKEGESVKEKWRSKREWQEGEEKMGGPK